MMLLLPLVERIMVRLDLEPNMDPSTTLLSSLILMAITLKQSGRLEMK
jgi:hypothetical protein